MFSFLANKICHYNDKIITFYFFTAWISEKVKYRIPENSLFYVIFQYFQNPLPWTFLTSVLSSSFLSIHESLKALYNILCLHSFSGQKFYSFNEILTVVFDL